MTKHTEARYEFRIFGLDLQPYKQKLAELSEKSQTRQMQWVYLLATGNTDNNVKIGEGVTDIKVLKERYKGLELWSPFFVREFPLHTDVIKTVVFSALGVSNPKFSRIEYTLEQFIAELITPDRNLPVAYVNKKRQGYYLNDCIAEIAEIIVNGAFIKTMCIESENPEKVLATKKLLGIDESLENVNYPLALKRIMGLVGLPENWKK